MEQHPNPEDGNITEFGVGGPFSKSSIICKDRLFNSIFSLAKQIQTHAVFIE